MLTALAVVPGPAQDPSTRAVAQDKLPAKPLPKGPPDWKVEVFAEMPR